MIKQHLIDSMASEIEDALDLGSYISYQQVWDYVDNLNDVKERIDDMVMEATARQCVSLYVMFLSGCYEKADEIDDSGGNLGMFFEELFCSWIKARQKAGYADKETVHNILQWMENDSYGFCYNIEKKLVEALNRQGLSVFEATILARFDEALESIDPDSVKRIYDYPYDVRQNADILRIIYSTKKDIDSYLGLCDKVGTTPKDCENIANIYKGRRCFRDALLWVDKGLELEKKDSWPNYASRGLSSVKRDLLNMAGEKKEAFESAWSEFQSQPSEYTYDEMMKYVLKKDRNHWHKMAIEEIGKTSLPIIIELCTKTQEWKILAESIKAARHEEIEYISHYDTEKAAQGLSQEYPVEAAKIFRALGLRIVKAKKSKYYGIANEHLLKAKKLYVENNCQKEWSSLVENIRRDHYRKYSFIGDFEKIVSGEYPEYLESFEERTKKRWAKQISDK
ncbi:MAG: hypothetical protein HQ557_06665 [Bacteroidetes bacterium]|nr:hypothetical protein [Bacteroidota bacterium]